MGTYLKRLNDGRYEYGDLIRREGKHYEEVPRGIAPNYEAGCKVLGFEPVCLSKPPSAREYQQTPE
jgi:hypothetical protein